MKLVTDSGIVFVRELRPLVRDPFSVVFGLVQPLVFLGLFGPLLGGMPGLSTESSLQWFVPGVLVIHENRGLTDWVRSVADQLARQASIPILFVPPREEAPDLAREPIIRRVLVPLDGSVRVQFPYGVGLR